MKFVIEVGARLFGPFQTAEEATRFVTAQFSVGAHWSLRPVTTPEEA